MYGTLKDTNVGYKTENLCTEIESTKLKTILAGSPIIKL